MTMEKLTPPVGSDHQDSSPAQEYQKKMAVEEEDDDPENDAEVMQVVANDAVNLRPKKQRVIVNGSVGEDPNRERPMSWEGELSEDEVMSPAVANHDDKLGDGVYKNPPHPPSSPMCVVEKEESNHFIERQDPPLPETKILPERESGVDFNTAKTNNNGNISNPGTPPTVTVNKNILPSFGGGQPVAFAERLPAVPNTPIEPLVNHSPAQTRHIINYPSCYSQSPSPVLTRPTSSSSSRSSYSPTQSPLMGRYINSSSLFHSPVMSRHAAGNSSDGSIYSPSGSPLQGRHVALGSSLCSPTQSPSQGRRGEDEFSPTRSPAHPNVRRGQYGITLSPNQSHRTTPDQLLPPTGEGNIGLHTAYHYSSSEHPGLETRIHQVSPLFHHPTPETRSTTSSASVASSASDESNASDFSSPTRRMSSDNYEDRLPIVTDLSQGVYGLPGTPGISRQQLLSGPCPICGDRISGFHYGIFSCESCKGFFKRTVQNKKNYVCLRGANCHIVIGTRKKCPACRFDKCLKMGMKLEAIREDRTRGGRSTYQCSYALPTTPTGDGHLSNAGDPIIPHDYDKSDPSLSRSPKESLGGNSPEAPSPPVVPPLIQDILGVEHLWYNTDKEINKLSGQLHSKVIDGENDFLNNLTNIADNRLYKIVKWCKSLPLFREVQMDDQITLLINSWCELLLLSCCYRSMATPNEIRVSHGKAVSLAKAQMIGLGPVIERMLNLTDHFRRLQVDQYEYVSLKVIILLTSDASGLKEPDKVHGCQRQVLEALQTYTSSHYPHHPSKFGELLLRLPELERACQLGKESLASKQKAGEVPSFNLLVELLRGDH